MGGGIQNAISDRFSRGGGIQNAISDRFSRGGGIQNAISDRFSRGVAYKMPSQIAFRGGWHTKRHLRSLFEGGEPSQIAFRGGEESLGAETTAEGEQEQAEQTKEPRRRRCGGAAIAATPNDACTSIALRVISARFYDNLVAC